MAAQEEITRLLKAWGDGDRDALDQLVPLVERELRRLARNYMRRQRPDHTLQTSALINEAYAKLLGRKKLQWKGRSHFFVIAARSMRNILVDYARTRQRAKRGGKWQKIALSDVPILSEEKIDELLAIDEALGRLAAIAQRQAQVVELRFFGGLSVEETAEELHVSEATVKNDWALARAWLKRELSNGTLANDRPLIP